MQNQARISLSRFQRVFFIELSALNDVKILQKCLGIGANSREGNRPKKRYKYISRSCRQQLADMQTYKSNSQSLNSAAAGNV